MENLQNSVEIWYNIYNPKLAIEFKDEEKVLLDRLNRIGFSRFSSLTLAIYLKKPSVDLKIKLLSKMERLAFLSMLVFYRFYIPIIDFSLIAIKVQKGEMSLSELSKTLDQNIKEVLERESLTERLIDNFKKEGFYNWIGIRYFLYEYEVSIRDKTKAKKNKIDWIEYKNEEDDFITVEHIYPQTPKSECWKEGFSDYSLKEKKILNNSLGNLLPLSRPKNSSLQNKCFLDKIDNGTNYIGFKYGSYSENEISGLSAWTPNEILERGIKLLKFMEERWGLDFGSDEKRKELLNLNFLTLGSKVQIKKKNS